jgi:hypothetical protein
MVEHQPIDIDRLQPMAPSREMAMVLLERFVPDAKQAQDVWTALLAPLYERQRYVADYPNGRCRRCGIPHPASPMGKLRAASGLPQIHRMYCSKYVGPLTHHSVKIEPSFYGDRVLCSCGKTYPYWADDDASIRGTCPDGALVWRGPHPDDEGGSD